MNARLEAEQLRQSAIAKLLDERKEIDAELKRLGYGEEIKTAPSGKRRGRPSKNQTIEVLDSSSDTDSPAERLAPDTNQSGSV